MLLSVAWLAGMACLALLLQRKAESRQSQAIPSLPSISLLSESTIQVEALKWHLFNKLLAAGQYCYNEVVTRSGRKQVPGLVW